MNKKSYRELVKSLLKESGSSCPLCEGGTVGEDGVCKNCKHHFPKKSNPGCPLCEGGTIGEDGVCKNCKHHFPV